MNNQEALNSLTSSSCDKNNICTEICPYCEAETEYVHNTDTQGFIVKCKICGAEVFLCDDCMHREDNSNQECNWSAGKCFRGQTKNRKK